MRRISVLIIISVYSMSACGKSSSHQVDYSTVDGIPLVRTTGAPKYDYSLFELESDLIIGIEVGEPEWQMFAGSPRFLVAPDGKMILCDNRRFEIFIISQEGELLVRFGKKGGGPGEFQNLGRMYWAEYGIEFWVEDQSLSRVNRFSMDGKYLDSFNYAEQRNTWRSFQSLGQKRFLGLNPGLVGSKDPFRYAFLDSIFHRVSDFTEVPPQQMWQTSATSWGTIPLTEVAGVTVSPDGELLSYHPYIPRLTIYSPFGGSVLHIQRDWEFKIVSDEDKERIRRQYRESSSERRRALADKIPFPAKRAAFYSARMDEHGRIWVCRDRPYWEEDNSGYLFDIFGSDGIWLGTEEISFNPYLIQGRYMYTYYAVDSGAPRFERFLIIPHVPELENHK